MRGGIILLRRTGLGTHTMRGRRGYDGLRLGACSLSAPPVLLAPAQGHSGAQGQVASIAEGPDRSHGHAGTHGQVVVIPARLATGAGQAGAHATTAYVAVRTTATLGSVGIHGAVSSNQVGGALESALNFDYFSTGVPLAPLGGQNTAGFDYFRTGIPYAGIGL